ncbi:MAG: hypothetical protein H7335_19125, partial [Massilia sp.]|nr:hypothetical protein [Massilia sp.]
ATGPTKVELEKVRQIWLQNHQKALRENGFWTARLQAAQLQGDGPALILTYEKRVNALSTDDVKKAAQRYFDTKNYVQVVMYPEK